MAGDDANAGGRHAVRMYTTRWCPYCIRARELLDAKGIAYEDLAVDNDPALRQHMQRISGRRTVPQIFIGNRPIGGYDELAGLEHRGRLDALLGGDRHTDTSFLN